MGNNLEYLQNIPIFSHLSGEELVLLDSITKVRKYRKNMIVFVEDEYGDEFYFVKSGKVKLSKLLEDGSEKTLHFSKPGDIFAEILLFGGGSYPATAEIIEDAEIGIIENQELETILKQNAEMAIKILKYMAERLRSAQYHVRDLALRDAYGRLACCLVDLVDEYGKETKNGIRIGINLSQQELANLVGTSRETVARILGIWKKDGLVNFQKQTIEVLDLKGLEKWL